MWPFKKNIKKNVEIISAKELKVLMQTERIKYLEDLKLKKEQERIALRENISKYFINANHPWRNFISNANFNNDLVDELKLELEILGYELLIKTEEHIQYFSQDNTPVTKIIEYREIRIKE